jgi:hypothetical protein
MSGIASRRLRRNTLKSATFVVISAYFGCNSLMRIRHKSARSGRLSRYLIANSAIRATWSAKLKAGFTNPVRTEIDHQAGIAEVQHRFGQHSLTGQQRFNHPPR